MNDDTAERRKFDEALLIDLLSPARWEKWRRLAQSPSLAFEIHDLDGRMAIHLLGAHRCFEIWFRNRIDRRMTEIYRHRDWLFESDIEWNNRQRNHVGHHWELWVAEAWKERRSAVELRSAHHDRCIAGASFGFWAHLFTDQVANRTWQRGLRTLFPDGRLGHRDVFRRLDDIAKARNRAAHHDAVLPRRARTALTAYNWILTSVAPHVRSGAENDQSDVAWVRERMSWHAAEIVSCAGEIDRLRLPPHSRRSGR